MLLHQGYHTPQGAAIEEYKEMVWEGVDWQERRPKKLGIPHISPALAQNYSSFCPHNVFMCDS
jgi:hypothetical protein